MDESRRPGCTHHEEEGWTHASGAQGRTCGRPVERRSAGYHAAAGQGDTDTIHKTLAEAQSAAREIKERAVEEVVADKGYHSGAVPKELHQQGVRTYIPEPDRRRRKWEGKAVEQKRTYENRRRVRGDRGRQLQKRRSELTERSFAHLYETGGMR